MESVRTSRILAKIRDADNCLGCLQYRGVLCLAGWFAASGDNKIETMKRPSENPQESGNHFLEVKMAKKKPFVVTVTAAKYDGWRSGEFYRTMGGLWGL